MALLQERLIILRSLLVIATPYVWHDSLTYIRVTQLIHIRSQDLSSLVPEATRRDSLMCVTRPTHIHIGMCDETVHIGDTDTLVTHTRPTHIHIGLVTHTRHTYETHSHSYGSRMCDECVWRDSSVWRDRWYRWHRYEIWMWEWVSSIRDVNVRVGVVTHMTHSHIHISYRWHTHTHIGDTTDSD